MINTAKPMSPALRLRKRSALAGLSFAFATSALAQSTPIPQNGEYPVSGPLNGDQTAPRSAISAGGGFSVWQEGDGNGYGIGARRLDAGLSPVGAAIRVNESTAGDQERPSVALLPNGGAVVVFQSGRKGFQDIYARFLNSDGSFASRDISVNPTFKTFTGRFTTNWLVFRNNRPVNRTQRIKQILNQKQERNGGAVVATLNDGTVVVVYTSGRRIHEKVQTLVHKTKTVRGRSITNSILQFVESDFDGMEDVYFQRFTAHGEKLGGETRVNQNIYLNQNNPSIAVLSDGTFLIAWNSDEQSGFNTIDVIARRFDALGNPLGDEFVANTVSRPCGNPVVAARAEGGATIAWAQRSVERTNSLDINARAFDGSLAPAGEPFLVNAHRYGDQFSPSIASAAGGQVIVWTSLGQDGSREGVYGRALNNGVLAGDEFRVNTTTYLRQFHPHISSDASGRFLAVWSSYQTAAAFDVFGQRYTLP